MSDILIKRNHMEIPWHNYVSARNNQPITEASLSEKASLIGRTGMMLLSCGTGAWRVRSSMNWYHLFRRYRTDVYKLHLL